MMPLPFALLLLIGLYLPCRMLAAPSLDVPTDPISPGTQIVASIRGASPGSTVRWKIGGTGRLVKTDEWKRQAMIEALQPGEIRLMATVQQETLTATIPVRSTGQAQVTPAPATPTPPNDAASSASAGASSSSPAEPTTYISVAPAPAPKPMQQTAVSEEILQAPPPPSAPTAPPSTEVENDETPPTILPISGTEPTPPPSDLGLNLRQNPAPLLETLGGGRPGGHVTALTTLLRQTGGPLRDDEDNAMMRQWAPHAASASPKAQKAISAQNELLLKAMVYRQMMVQAAWEYDFALAQREMAIQLQDDEEAGVATTIAELQQGVVEHAQAQLKTVAEASDQAPAIPSAEELQAEDEAARKNAEAALGLSGGATTPVPPGKTLLGYLRYDKTFVRTRCKTGPQPFGGGTVSCDVGERSVTYEHSNKDYLEKFTCSWEAPELIPVVDQGRINSYGLWQSDRPPAAPNPKLPFRIILDQQAGDEKSDVRADVIYSEIAEDEPSQTLMPQNLVRPYVGFYPDLKLKEGNHFELNDLHYPAVGLPIQNDASIPIQKQGTRYVYICIVAGWRWTAFVRYKWEPSIALTKAPTTEQDPLLADGQNERIAEHEANIAAAQRAIQGIRKEMAAEKNPTRREELRLQSLHLEQDIHDSKDLIASIKTGTLVKTRGPWDEHASVVMAQSTQKMIEDFRRAQQMQAAYARMLKVLEKHNPEEARRFHENFRSQMIQGIYDPGGFDKAKTALAALADCAGNASRQAQQKNLSEQSLRQAQLATAERNLALVEGIKKQCDRGIFIGSLAMGMAPGLVLTMAYEGACTSVEKGPKEAIKNMAVQGGIMLGCMGVMKVGGWAIGKLLNPKVAQSEMNTFKNLLEANRHQQELEWNRALVAKLKDKTAAFEKAKASGGKNYLQARIELDDAVAAVNSSSLAKNVMKNELAAAEKTLIKQGTKEAATAVNEINAYQNIYNKRLQNSIYPRTDSQMVNSLRKQGYNVESDWFREFRNATSRGANRDRDLGLLASMEGKLTKNGQTVPLTDFMKDAQKHYDTAYKQVTGRSSKLADQSVTTTAHSEAFPLSWLENKMAGGGKPAEYSKAGQAIYNKVRNAMTGPDPAFVNLKKACGSLSKDLKTKVFPRLEKPAAGSSVSSTSRQAATEHWNRVQEVMDDFASDRIDPLTAMRKLQQLTGSTSITQSAAEVQRLMLRLGGAVP
jgi:hypothetical protein